MIFRNIRNISHKTGRKLVKKQNTRTFLRLFLFSSLLNKLSSTMGKVLSYTFFAIFSLKVCLSTYFMIYEQIHFLVTIYSSINQSTHCSHFQFECTCQVLVNCDAVIQEHVTCKFHIIFLTNELHDILQLLTMLPPKKLFQLRTL